MLKRFLNSTLLMTAAVASMALASACSGDDSSGDDDDNGGTGGTGAMGGTGGTGGGTCTPGGNIALAIDSSGWMDMTTPCNDDVAVQGSWYPYGDQYGDGEGDSKCTKFGGHMASECATIISPPPPPEMGFTNVNGAMHTEGSVEAILPCVPGSMAATLLTSGCPDHDYSNMWGAGIGFDINADKGEEGGAKHTWDPAAHGVVGIRFTIDAVPLPGLRVEFPMLLQDADGAKDTPVALPPGSTTDSHSAGAPYWGAQLKGDAKYPPSPIAAGVNTIIFATDVQPPKLSAYAWEQNRMLGVQFHVPTGSTAGTYSFTISDVKLLRDPGQP
jgi:hypothetical protein